MFALAIFWFIIIFVVICGYFVLDGFDLGVGVAYPFLAKNEREQAILRYEVGPVWDGNEVWLLTAGGALFAAFGPAYATTFSGFYLAIMLVLFGLIFRVIGLEFYSRDLAPKKLCDGLFVVGSFLPALLLGVAVGNVLAGLPLDANGDYMGSFFALLNPFALLCGLVGLAQFVSLGCAWTAVKTLPGDLHDRAVDLRGKAQIAVVVLFVLATVCYFVQVPSTMAGDLPLVVPGVCAALVVIAFLAEMAFGRKGEAGDLPNFLAAAVICLGLVALTATSLFPNIVPAVDPAHSVTIASAAGSDVGLGAMTVILCIGLPLVLFYHFLVYRTFAGKVTDADIEGAEY